MGLRHPRNSECAAPRMPISREDVIERYGV
jgi:hypothetical protein